MAYRLGIDIGGTFTDFVAYDESGRALRAWKNLSTPQDPIQGIMTGLRAFGDIPAIRAIRLGTTVATNIALTHQGGNSGVLAYLSPGARRFQLLPDHVSAKVGDLIADIRYSLFIAPSVRRLISAQTP